MQRGNKMVKAKREFVLRLINSRGCGFTRLVASLPWGRGARNLQWDRRDGLIGRLRRRSYRYTVYTARYDAMRSKTDYKPA